MRRAAFFFAALLGIAPAKAAFCDAPDGMRPIAQMNATSQKSAQWSFTEGRPGAVEGPGWAVYAPLTMATIATTCAPDTPAFALALFKWQGGHGLKATGLMSPDTAEALKSVWNENRRHVARAAAAPCNIANPGQVVDVPARDIWAKPEKLLPGAYAAYRRMIEAARREAPGIFAGDADLKIVSAWRTPEGDAAKCKDGGCSPVSMAPSCSAHWSGVAVDLDLGFVDGHDPTDMDWQNRLYQTRQPAYRWLVKNARRFGFVNYFAEPWHWEWQG